MDLYLEQTSEKLRKHLINLLNLLNLSNEQCIGKLVSSPLKYVQKKCFLHYFVETSLSNGNMK